MDIRLRGLLVVCGRQRHQAMQVGKRQHMVIDPLPRILRQWLPALTHINPQQFQALEQRSAVLHIQEEFRVRGQYPIVINVQGKIIVASLQRE